MGASAWPGAIRHALFADFRSANPPERERAERDGKDFIIITVCHKQQFCAALHVLEFIRLRSNFFYI